MYGASLFSNLCLFGNLVNIFFWRRAFISKILFEICLHFWVWTVHGLKVSSLYISQIKRKCGLDVGQNYNLSKKEDAKVPKCPPEKEAAIRDALKYFQMI